MNEKDIKRWLGRIPWWAIALLFVFGLAPVGALLLLVKLFAGEKDPKVIDLEYAPPLESEAVPKVDTRINKPKKANATTENQKKNKNKKISNGIGMRIMGVILLLMGVFSFGGALQAWTSWNAFFTALAFLIGGGALFYKGWQKNYDKNKFQYYMNILGDKSAISIEELAKIDGISVKKAEKNLRRMTEAGYFGDTAYINMELGYLFRNSEADRATREEVAAREAERKAAQESNVPNEAESGYSGILRNIRRANDQIADPVLSAKIDQLEDITSRIFRAVEADPSKTGQIERFLNYYLPTTQKLLDSYAEFEAAGIEGENLTQAKTRISSTMDMILKGFSHQLDELYKSDFMDVDSDIRVMETMLKRDTASASEDFGLHSDSKFKSDFKNNNSGGNVGSGNIGSVSGSKRGDDFGSGQAVAQQDDEVYVGIDFGDRSGK